MQKLDIHDFYILGKRLQSVQSATTFEETTTLGKALFHIFWAQLNLTTLLKLPCPLLPSSQRAARKVLEELRSVSGSTFEEMFAKDHNLQVASYTFGSLKSALEAFEAILQNDMPEMSTFSVEQIGILRTDDLINCAFKQLPEKLHDSLLSAAKNDINAAGRCLAFRLPTASAFHSCRAIEACIDQYFEAVTGKPYAASPSGGNNNWGAKTEALIKAGAETKVTEFLTHIRKQYRNPVSHPELFVENDEAAELFVAALGALSMMLREVQSLTGSGPAELQTSALLARI